MRSITSDKPRSLTTYSLAVTNAFDKFFSDNSIYLQQSVSRRNFFFYLSSHSHELHGGVKVNISGLESFSTEEGGSNSKLVLSIE